ncbi:MAG: RNA polymerase sigma factor [Myxococcales bacterium]|nr:RNA polymerase sigma factor [Myxococcales bacterium]
MPADDPEPVSDEALLERVARGDHAALRTLVERHGPRVRRLAARLLGSAADAQDAAQDVFVAVFRNAGSFEPVAKFSTWLHRVTVNRCLTELESRRVRRRALADLTASDRALPAARGGPAADPASDPADRQIERRERIRRLERALGALSPRQRAAVVLHRFEGLGYAEIAATLGCSVSSVESLLSRARATLADRLRGS